MAAAIGLSLCKNKPIEVEARGIVVNFPEPMNPKAQAVLASHGMDMPEYVSKRLVESDFTEGSLVIVMESAQRNKVLALYSGATEDNVRVLADIVGEELETMDPYGEPLVTYGLCFEMLKTSIEKLVAIIG